MAKKAVQGVKVEGEKLSPEMSLFYKEDGKSRWFEPDTSALSGDSAKHWDAYQELLAEANAARVQFELAFYASLQKAAKAGKLNGHRALEVGINKSYAISFGYKWGKLSISFNPDASYAPSRSGGGSNKFSF